MDNIDEARELAESMVQIASMANRKAVAVISDMNQPLGEAVGNALEVKEAIATLQGGGPSDFREHCLEIAGHMLVLGEKAADLPTAKENAARTIADGSAWERFVTLIEAQGGDSEYIRSPEKLPPQNSSRSYRLKKAATSPGCMLGWSVRRPCTWVQAV